MSTVRRTIRSIPYRDSIATWRFIMALLTRDNNATAAAELEAVTGIVASVIGDGSMRQTPIVVTCDGPRTRLYCIYDEDALDEAEASEDALGFDPLKGDWSVSLPCQAEDLEWVQRALAGSSKRITARDTTDGFEVADSTPAASTGNALTLDLEGLLK
ncbi:hypothetical protein [Luteimonas sp. YGD11-2]|uniref:hypothetical protein n=1 Tax=Luteimonas sp. YGD11-2 TaxID=2508168 RepID=UPI00100A6D75|nr:hypothetical protein [Luteimonas sp. YGD11-2]